MSFEQRTLVSRRKALRYAAAVALGPVFKFTGGPAAAQTRPAGGVTYGSINKYSAPSDLKITDLRSATIAANFDFPIIRMDTNQGVYGLGEVRDGGMAGSALLLKPLLVGRSPLDITGILRACRPHAGHGRLGGGYSAIDICLHDLVGKVYGVPIWRLLGDKKRDRIRLYCDTTGTADPKLLAQRVLKRKQAGFTFIKFDITTNWVDKPGGLDSNRIMTEKGLAYAAELITAAREALGPDVPIAVDGTGPGNVKDAIRYAKSFEKFNLAWVEDMLPWTNWRGYKQLRDATSTKVLTGEDIFGYEQGFQPLIENDALDIVHPDPGTSGACRETKRIADFAHMRGIMTALHMPGSPLGAMACSHVACTLDNLVAQEFHSQDFVDWWQKLVTRPILEKGYITVSDSPGLGLELNEPVVREHLRYPGYFEPTPMYDQPITVRVGPRGPWPHYNVDGKWVNEATTDY